MKHRSKIVRNAVLGMILCAMMLQFAACATGNPQSTADSDKTTAPTDVTEPTKNQTTAPQSHPTEPDTAPKDTTPPEVSGEDFTVEIGSTVSYKKQITVSDDSGVEPTIEVDNSAVDLDKLGVYPVVYTVTDGAGNKTVLTLHMTVIEREIPVGATEEYVLKVAKGLLDEMLKKEFGDSPEVIESLPKMQVAYTIYRWTKTNIKYHGSTDKTNWVIGAYDTFNERRGDCYGYYSVAKALLTAAGIDNVDIVKKRTNDKTSRHYWLLVNVGDGWYHMDCTRFKFANDNFFLLTNEEIWKWDDTYYKGEHVYVEKGLPEIATKSVQDRINYASSRLKY